MEYVFEKKIIYRRDNNSLHFIETGDSVVLTLPAARLLDMLIDSKGEILGREHILTNVWENYGLEASNNNLNNYISLLRKTFSTYGINDLIITIPKTGFRLNELIKIEKTKNDLNESYSIAGNEKKIAFFKGRIKYLISIYSFFFIAGLFVLKDNKNEEINISSVVIEKGCTLTLLNNVIDSQKQEYALIGMGILKKKGIICNDKKNVYLHFMKNEQFENLTRILISVCSKSDGNSNDICQTYDFNQSDI